MANREYPHDIEAERSLLGAMLISKEEAKNILENEDSIDIKAYLIPAVPVVVITVRLEFFCIKPTARQLMFLSWKYGCNRMLSAGNKIHRNALTGK